MKQTVHLISAIMGLLCAILLSSCASSLEDESKYEGREVSIAHLKSLCRSQAEAIKEDLIIVGRVVANDKLGELNRAIAIMDDTAGVELKIDVDYVDLEIPLYSEVAIRCSGLWLGREGEKIVLGSEPTSHYVVDRIASNELFNIVKRVTLPNDMPMSRRRTIAEVNPLDMNCLVRIENIRFTEAEDGLRWCDIDEQTGRYITTLRYAEDDTGVIGVVVDGNCDYRMENIPTEVVTCYAIVDSYASQRVLRITNHGVIRP